MAKINKKMNLTNEQISFLKKLLNVNKMEDIKPSVLKKLKEQLKTLDDKRQQSKIKYKMWDIICYVIFASFAGIESWEDIEDFVEMHYKFFRSFLKMTGGVPNWQTIERVMAIIDSKELENILVNFIITMTFNQKNVKDIISIDGRVDKGSGRKETDFNEKVKVLNVLNAYSNNYGMCLASEMINDKTNEIPTIPTILSRLNIKNTIVTWDALNTQKENIEAVVAGHGDYVIPIKGNHPTFYDELKLYFDDKKCEQIIAGNLNSSYTKEQEKSHSSFIIYEYFQTSDIKWYTDYKDWKKLRSIGMVKKTIIQNGKEKVEIRYYISSLNINIHDFSNAIRNHWNVENKLHWHLDFTFKEVKNTTINKRALMNLQLVNKFCLAILNRIKPFYNNISLRRIKNITRMDYENKMAENLCYLLVS